MMRGPRVTNFRFDPVPFEMKTRNNITQMEQDLERVLRECNISHEEYGKWLKDRVYDAVMKYIEMY